MSAYKRTGRRIHTVNVPVLREKPGDEPRVEWVQRTTGTRDRETAKHMQRMLDALGPVGRRAWDLLGRLDRKEFDVARLYDVWVAKAGDLEAIRTALEDVDLEPYVQTWYDAMVGPAGGMSIDTADHYLSAVRTLLPETKAFARSALTHDRLETWLENMADVESGTVRKRGQGMRRFTRWLLGKKVLSADPMRDVKLPPPGKPRTHYLETPDATRLADAQASPFREFAALLAGSGIEVSVAVGLRVRDVDVKHKEIRAPGTKTHSRDRIVRVADWAWKYVAPLVKHRHPDARLFEEISDRWAPQQPHADAINALLQKGHAIYAGYTMRDHRHTYAVRAIRAGTPPELVARQLGHVNAVLVHSTYGRFSPNQDERDKWEKIAAEQDKAAQRAAAKAEKVAGSIGGTNR
jgi:integrase